MKSKILVTGGAGYIGSHTVVELLKEGNEVIIVDDLSNSKIEVLDNMEKISGIRPTFYQFNLCDLSLLKKCLVKEEGINSIIHFAASKAVGESVEKPLLYYQNNLVSLLNLLTMMREFDISNIVFSSSCTVYGQPEKLPVTEESPYQSAESPYGNTKQISEEILKDASKAYDEIKSIALRYFNPVGAHATGLIGELPLGIPNNLIPFVTQTAVGIREQLNVFGSDYHTPDGTAIRDYIHVVDLAKAHVVALHRLLGNKNKSDFEFFNIGTGNGYSVLEVIKTFEKVNQVKVNYQLVDRRPGDIEQIYADTSFANKELGWKAELGLEEMMLTAWKWQQNQVDGN